MYTVYVQRNKRFNLKHYEHPEAYHTIHTQTHTQCTQHTTITIHTARQWSCNGCYNSLQQTNNIG